MHPLTAVLLSQEHNNDLIVLGEHRSGKRRRHVGTNASRFG